MRVSLNWLNDYVEIGNFDPNELAKTLTSLGIEVETIEHICPIKGEVVVGRIVTADPHPNADSLKLCSVDVGKTDPLQIVCGAHNAKADIFVAVATVGSTLPGDFKIKASKIRGEKSYGMMCSERELGLSDQHDAIIELPPGHMLGAPIENVLNLSDTVFTLGVTPNRADCLGYVGIARELAAKLDLELKSPSFETLERQPGLSTNSAVEVQIIDHEDCTRFCALYLKNITNADSPGWLQRRLTAGGMRPINLMVDITNYVMLEYGQPIHAYDERFVSQSKIIVRPAKNGERFMTLDGQERKLLAGDVLICDTKGPIGLAGVMGGENSEVRADTRNVIIEVARFNPIKIRKTSKRLGMHTEASHRFERGVDLDALPDVALRVAQLYDQCAHELGIERPAIAEDILDNYPREVPASKIALRMERFRTVTGLALVSQQEVTKSLESLGFALLDHKDERLLFSVPSWRHDILREIDLIEEVARLVGFDKIPKSHPIMEIRPLRENPFIEFVERARLAMATGGFCENIAFPFIGGKDLDRLLLDKEHPFRKTVKLQNALVSDASDLQSTLLVNMLKSISHNHRHGDYGVRLFEIARTFHHHTLRSEAIFEALSYLRKGIVHLTPRAIEDERPIEVHILCGCLDQPGQPKDWRNQESLADFFDGKAAAASWLAAMGIADVSYVKADTKAFPFLHPGKSAEIQIGNTTVGYIGVLHPRVCQNYELDVSKAPVVFELYLESLYERWSKPKSFQTEVKRYPPSIRDLAFVVDSLKTHNDFSEAIAQFRKRNLSSFSLFDVYEGANLPQGKKSVAYKFSFQSPKRTLSDKEVEQEVNLLVTWLEEKLQATLR